MYKSFIKRGIDIVASLIGLVILSPLIVLITILLLITNRGKPFFIQKRPGKNEEIFNIVKFKTMNDLKDSKGNLLPDESRLTPIGRFIRKTSLDEILQLLNVLSGKMSLIGPRPLLIKYLPLYNDFQKKRHVVKPGITGFAQVNGRNAISWQDKFKFDVYYVENLSFILDMKILWLTILKVLKSEGISSATSVTAEEFEGNSN